MKQIRQNIPSPCANLNVPVSTATEGVKEVVFDMQIVPSVEWSPDIIGQVAELLAEALVLDFQSHRKPMDNSPPHFGQK